MVSLKLLCPAHAIASEVESFTIGHMIRGYHARLQRCSIELCTVREVLYRHHYETGAEGSFVSGNAAKQQCLLSCKET